MEKTLIPMLKSENTSAKDIQLYGMKHLMFVKQIKACISLSKYLKYIELQKHTIVELLNKSKDNYGSMS